MSVHVNNFSKISPKQLMHNRFGEGETVSHFLKATRESFSHPTVFAN